MTKSETALQDNVVWLDKNQLIHVVYRGDQTRKKVRETVKKVRGICDLLRSQQYPVLVIVDTRDIGKYPAEARVVGLRARTELPFWRMAIVTAKDDINRAISISHRLNKDSSLRKEICYFTSLTSANTWLHQLRSTADILYFFKPII